MSKGGTTDPVMSIEIASFDVFSPEKNPEYANKILDFVHEQLNLPYPRYLQSETNTVLKLLVYLRVIIFHEYQSQRNQSHKVIAHATTVITLM